MGENRDTIVRWLNDGETDHPALTEGGKLNAVIAMFLQVSIM